MVEKLTAAEQSVLRDAEASIRLINVALEARGRPVLELSALEAAQARTIATLDSLLGQESFWQRLSEPAPATFDRAAAKVALTDELADVLIRVGHVPPPPAAEILDIGVRSLDDLPTTGNITAADTAAAAKVALHYLHARLRRMTGVRDDDLPSHPAPLEARRATLGTARSALLHVLTAGGLALRKAPAAVTAATYIATQVVWGGAINIATDLLPIGSDKPPAVQPAPTGVTPSGRPLADLRELHRQERQIDPAIARDLRQDLLDDLLGSNQWTPTYRLVRLDQLITDGAVPAAEAATARAELERLKLLEERTERGAAMPPLPRSDP
ncbi:hypothetical protein [Actinoplanes sp. URMC 104]|uniref:hypothetical protein n=1 Tax=Actinoplanes sp. URMC 104 TaxID=3423409 RepID=UPI003F1D9CBB